MAEIVVSLLMDKLISLLRDEISLLSNVHSQVMSVTEQLQLIKAYLKDADTKAETEKTNNLLKEWVTQMRQVSFRLEDVTDKYLLKMAKHPRTCDAAGVLCRICGFFRTVKPWHEISSQIGEIMESLERLNKARETYGFNPSSLESHSAYGAEISMQHYLRLGAHFIEDDQLVGVEHVKHVLTGWLLEGESSRTVISVVGEGGQGKTTIVNKLYTEQKEEKSFDCYAWVTVSRSVRGEQVLQTLIQSFYEGASNKNVTKEINGMDNNNLIRTLREYLQGRNYMIVFDDVWETCFWGGVEFALPKDKGRIIITTRDRRVAEFCGSYGPIHIHDMEPLNPDDAWNLFCIKAFPEGFCPENLTRLSEDFVMKCKGVPLAIVAIAGLLSTKNQNLLMWQRVYDSLRSKLSSDPHLSSFHQVLSESYHDLGYHLKLCLLYFGLFPEDYTISCVRLINLWIAEGFVEDKESEGQTHEEVAEEYLAELIARNLVKVAEVYSYGRVKSCKVHDLMHDFILKKCEELDFCSVKKSKSFSFHEWTRRLSFDMNIIEEAKVKRSSASYGLVRTCFVFNIKQMPATLVESLFSSFKLLIRLDCEDAPLDYLPKAIESLFNLKYLNLRNTKIKKIPKFVGNLQKLETLDLKGTQVSELPLQIYRLSNLRHLLVYSSQHSQVSVKLKQGIGHLTSLQKLSKVDAGDDGVGVISELKNLTQLRRLGIKNLTREDGKQLCSAIENMTSLSSLSIASAKLYDNEVLELESLTNPPRHLQRLYLAGCLEKLPHWISKLKNLVRLTLCHSGLREDPLPLLKDLPELLELELWKSYKGTEIHFKEGWFKKLKTLQICGMPWLRAFKIDEGALPKLQFLGINPRPLTVEVPTRVMKVLVC